MNRDNILEVNNLSHSFRMSGNNIINAVKDISFNIKRNEIFGLIGESGSGKSTAARCIMNIIRPLGGSIVYDGICTTDRHEAKKNRVRLQRERQIIFQDSTSSLNRYMKVEDIIAEPLRIQRIFSSRIEESEFISDMLLEAGLDDTFRKRKPYTLSGGQRQRVAIARAFAMKPKLLVADEPFSSLDVGVQMQMVGLFRHLKEEHDCAILFIAHDLMMVKFICDSVGVMQNGHIVEYGTAEEVFHNPKHPYTQKLIESIPIPDITDAE